MQVHGSAEQSFVFDNLERLRTEGALDVREAEETVRNCAAIIYIGTFSLAKQTAFILIPL